MKYILLDHLLVFWSVDVKNYSKSQQYTYFGRFGGKPSFEKKNQIF